MPFNEKIYPDWVQAFRTRGTTVKKKGDSYYLYKRTSKRVPGKKYPQPVDTYIGLITPEGIIKSGKKKLDISCAEVREFGLSKALRELCPRQWKELLGDEWEDVFLYIVRKWSPQSYLLKDRVLRDVKELQCSMSAQYGLFERRFFKEHKINVKDLAELGNIYIIYIDGKQIISKISESQRELLNHYHINPEVD